jgi:hypothetical protein
MTGATRSIVNADAAKVEVTFYDSYVPSIKDGVYTLTVTQSLASDNPKVQSPPEPPVSQTFIVRGPRFGLVPSDIHRAFPPPTSTGVYVDFLPMIVFNKRALPWECRMRFSVPHPEAYPWMALLVFSQDELQVPRSDHGFAEAPPPNSQANPTRTASFPLTEVVHAIWNGKPTKGPPAGIVGPSITLAEDEDPDGIQVNVIEVGAEAFANLMPTVKDLAYLAHVRLVSTENKEPQNAVHDGWYSVLIGNRFAVPPHAAPQRTNVVHLVSLEGLEPYIGVDAPGTPPGPVRLISLYSWAYTSLAAPQENFRELMLNLISTASQQGTDLLMRLPLENASGAKSDAEKSALERLDNGYVPLSYATLTGESTFAWYRGPLAPVVTTRFLDVTGAFSPLDVDVPLNTSEAMIYDPCSGLFDQSYAVAFQTGRSLALADQPFATNLLQWRRDAHRLVDQLMEQIRSPHLPGILQGQRILDADGELADCSVDDLSRLLDTDIVSDAFLSYLATEFGKSVATRVGQSGGIMPDDPNRTQAIPHRPPPTPADLARLIQHPAVVSLLQQRSGLESDGHSTEFQGSLLPEQVVQWLEQAALLYGVPFNNLVPSARLLPEESIRFFYADLNWIDALLDGALSVGIQSSRDALLQRLMRDPLHRTVNGVLHQVRERLRGVSPSSAAPPALICGFVLRSAVVSGWPGLEVRAFSDAARTMLITPLRLDRVSPSVLIGIFPEVPVAIELNEPSEGLVFGREDNGISLRYLPGTQGATPANIGHLLQPPVWLSPAEIAALRRAAPEGTGALRIAGTGGLVEALQSRFPGTPPTLSPASLAVEMAIVPEQMLFLPVLQNRGQ